jgi:hypothetical protein
MKAGGVRSVAENIKFRVYLCGCNRLSDLVLQRYSRKIRIDAILDVYRREGANKRALDKERARLEALEPADLDVLHAALTQAPAMRQRREI